MRYGCEALCDRCFMTGVDSGADPRHDVRPGGVQAYLDSTKLRIWMAPYAGESGPSVSVVVRPTNAEVTAMAEYISDAARRWQFNSYSGNTGLVLDGRDDWLRIHVDLPVQTLDREEIELSTLRMQGDRVRVLAFIPFASHDAQPHRGEAERFGRLLASMRSRDPDEFLRQQVDENLRDMFV